jgi:glycosyltransferase involved in cell wall biosynthesis
VRILAVNWLDLENPKAGGAEIHFFEIFSRMAARGHQVTLIASGWPGAAPAATIRGLQVRRYGGRHTFALHGRGAVRQALAAATYDVVVEDINKLPLYLPTLTTLPFYTIIPHLFGTTAFQEASLPVAATVWLAERAIPSVYARAAFHAISQSTADDLVARGVRREAIRVIYPGVDAAAFRPPPAPARTSAPTFLYVGRLQRYKGLETAIRAVRVARASGTPVELEIAGQGDDRPRLEELVAQQRLQGAVRFLGFVSEQDKQRLLQRAWGAVFPSAKEGWGITNVEAAACGTPAIASNSPGLRETVRDGITGVLVPHGDVAAMADAMMRFAKDAALVARLGHGARQFAETLSWETAGRETEAHLVDTIAQHGRRD